MSPYGISAVRVHYPRYNPYLNRPNRTTETTNANPKTTTGTTTTVNR